MSVDGNGSNPRTLNLEDIAEKAGVSRSTVSRVINNEPHVSKKTRDKVMAVIQQVGFVPNPAARMLVTQRTRTIGVVISQSFGAIFEDSFYFPTLLQGIADVTHVQDYAMLLWVQESSEDAERFYSRILQNRLMDGLVIASTTDKTIPFIQRLVELQTPFVMVERPPLHTDRISYVGVDNYQAARDAVAHLISLGRRRIATITGSLVNMDGQDRLAGYRAALHDFGMPIQNEMIVDGYFRRTPGYIAMKQLLQYQPDAVFIGSDQSALGALDALNELGVRVPDDIALIGFDDLPSVRRTTPPLTTVRQPIGDKGAQATTLLIDMIEERSTSVRQILLPTQLVIRSSCGAMLRSRPEAAS
ncbi:MAG: LacI family DNA-binding transcriptional regulator [bacterium]|nr:LacI family DNA-binding transcriptional regulator [bacterium]